MLNKRLKIVVLLTCLCSILFSCTLNLVDPNRFTKLQKLRNDSFALSDYSETLKTDLLIIDEFPKKIEGYDGAIEVLLLKNWFSDAERIADSSKSKIGSSESALLYKRIGLKYFEIGDYKNSEYCFTKSLDLNSFDQEVKVGMYDSLLRQGKVEEAGGYVLDENVKDFSLARFYLLSSFSKLGSLEAVQTAFIKIDTIDRTSSDYTEKLIFAGKSFNNVFDSMELALDKAQQYKDNTLYVPVILAREEIYAGYPLLAIQILEPKSDAFNNYFDGIFLLTRAYYDSGQFQKAIELSLKAEELGYDNFELQFLTAMAYSASNDQINAAKYFEKSILYASADQKMAYQQEYFDFLLSTEQNTKAVELLDYVSSKSTDSKTDYWLETSYVKVYFALKDYTNVYLHLEKTKSIVTTEEMSLDISMYYLRYYILTGSIDMASKEIEKISSSRPTDPEYNLYIGMNYEAASEKDNARKYYDLAIEYDLKGDIADKAQKLKDALR